MNIFCLFLIQAVSRNPLERLPVSSKSVMLKFSVMLLVDIVLLAIGTSMKLSKHAYVEGVETDDYGRITSLYSRCMPRKRLTVAVVFIFLSANILFLGTVIYQAYSSMQLMGMFTEIRYIAYAAFQFIEAWFIGAVMIFTIRHIPDAIFLGLSAIVFVCCMAIHSFIFFPKFLAMNRTNIRPHNHSSSRSILISFSQFFSSEANSISESTRSSEDIAEAVANNNINDDENQTST